MKLVKPASEPHTMPPGEARSLHRLEAKPVAEQAW